MAHFPNPYDFVPFRDKPILRTVDEFDAMGERWTGYLELRLHVLTPIHVVGTVRRGRTKSYGEHCRQDKMACIPAASIRGCLRSFLEALTAGWVSQVNALYPKEPGERHIGFGAFAPYTNQGRRTTRVSPPAIDPAYQPRVRDDGRLDVASYLFGMVIEGKRTDEARDNNLLPPARASKVWFEDAFVDDADLVPDQYWMPDIGGDAFMGGPKPNASSWWYFEPFEVQNRTTQEGFEVTEFVGTKLRGRKFYFHQDPVRCVNYYDPENGRWRYRPENPFHLVGLECVGPQTTTAPFRLYVNDVPTPLVRLLLLALLPGNNIRHKLGYGKAFGYGSVEFRLEAAYMRRGAQPPEIPGRLQDYTAQVSSWIEGGWDRRSLATANLESLIDWDALQWLARILGIDRYTEMLFVYPPYAEFYFEQAVSYRTLADKTGKIWDIARRSVDAGTSWEIADALYALDVEDKPKKAIYLRHYQETSHFWKYIKDRMP